MSTQAHHTAEREPDPERLFYGLPEPESGLADIFRDLLEPDPDPCQRRLTASEQGSLFGALAGLVLAKGTLVTALLCSPPLAGHR